MGLSELLIFLFKFWSSFFVSFWRLFFPVPPKDVRNELVLVTGAGHGMGRIEAVEFAKRGAIIIVVDINEDNNDETANLIREMGGIVHAYTCDVSKQENVKNLAAEIRQEVGDVSILVNNAGVIYVADISSLTKDKIQRTFDVNVLAHFWLIQEFLPAMKRKNHGHIVALASQAGLSGTPYMTDYCASKHAVVGLYESLRRELRWMKYDGIHVTYVCPLFVDTGFVKNPTMKGMSILGPEEVVDALVKGVLTNQAKVVLPNTQRFFLFARSIMTHAAEEALFDFIDPQCDKVDMKKHT
ncbi:estradiol 17-beta-dehydrogenase 11-like [Styela clava]